MMMLSWKAWICLGRLNYLTHSKSSRTLMLSTEKVKKEEIEKITKTCLSLFVAVDVEISQGRH